MVVRPVVGVWPPPPDTDRQTRSPLRVLPPRRPQRTVARLKRPLIIAFALGILGLVGASRAAEAPVEELASRVVILANSDDADSVRIAQHYASARGVPAANVIALPMPADETISWRQFIPQIWEPLLARLVRDRWIDAIGMDLVDPVGRKKYAVFDHRIAALVVCRGVPLRIEHDDSLYAEVMPFTTHHEFRTNAGAVDAELSLLALPTYPINAFIPNPLFQNDRPRRFEQMQVVKVARLDGPTAEAALGLVDLALAAERDGLIGRAYVDLSDRDVMGNGWLESAARQAGELGFDLAVDRAPAAMPATSRIDAPVLYFGWYERNIMGPFALPGFRFPPGAIALHIHSYSATTLRSTTAGWTGPFVARGVTATVGNVYEPYLELTHRPNLLLRALARGQNWIDAAYYAVQALSWQQVVIGDPLYRPFKVPLAEQAKRSAELSPSRAGYVALRQSHLLESEGRPAEAVALLEAVQRERPSLAVALALAERQQRLGDRRAAGAGLEVVASVRTFAPDEWAAARDAATLLSDAGQPKRAVAVWKALLRQDGMPAEVRIKWLREAAADAAKAGEKQQADIWSAEADALGAPVAAPTL